MKRQKYLDLFDYKLIIRALIFFAALAFFIIYENDLTYVLSLEVFSFVKIFHIIWLLLMLEMVIALIPKLNLDVGCGKAYKILYKPMPYDEKQLETERKNASRSAIKVAVVWILLIVCLGILRLIGYLTNSLIYLTVLFFYLSDQICINIWCPFRKLIMKNKCCHSCRIFNWGHFMIFSPLIYIPMFFTYSLLLMSSVILFMWERNHFLYKERFSELSNKSLKCSDCSAKCKWRLRK